MILLLSQDVRDHGSGRFNWKPNWFSGAWQGGRTWRICWGLWSLSYYPSPGCKEFFDHVESGQTEWRAK